jgi:hypothetical protein
LKMEHHWTSLSFTYPFWGINNVEPYRNGVQKGVRFLVPALSNMGSISHLHTPNRFHLQIKHTHS